jgi:hypothetical protein
MSLTPPHARSQYEQHTCEGGGKVSTSGVGCDLRCTREDEDMRPSLAFPSRHHYHSIHSLPLVHRRRPLPTMRSSSIQFALVALAGLASALPQGGVLGAIAGIAGPKPIKPSDDPFYTPAAGFESAKPGAILSSRLVPNGLSLLQLIPLQLQGAYQILYRTTDALGNATATITTILVPKNADIKKVVSYQVTEDSSGEINCAPSYGLQSGSDIEYSGTANIEAALIAAALNQGWVVNTPD